MKNIIKKALLLTLIASPFSAWALESTSALSKLGTALVIDAKACAAKTSEVAKETKKSTQKMLTELKQSIKNAHEQAKTNTVAIGEWIKNNPNATMAIAAASIVGYSVYKIHQLYLAYKKGAHHDAQPKRAQ